MTIPELDDTTIRAISLVCSIALFPKGADEAMAIADVFQEYIDPIQAEDEIEIHFSGNMDLSNG